MPTTTSLWEKNTNYLLYYVVSFILVYNVHQYETNYIVYVHCTYLGHLARTTHSFKSIFERFN